MISPDVSSTFSVSLALEAHTQAEQFRRQHSSPAKAKQVYLNTLAVYAVNFYLDCLGIETDLNRSSSWNPIQQTLLDTADLHLKSYGSLECRPVLLGATAVSVPSEVHQGRIGYVAVQLDQDLRQATLLGFIPNAVSETIPLDQLQPLEGLIEHIERQAAPARTTQLSQWLQNLVGEGWQTVETLLIPQQPAFAFRATTGSQPPPEATLMPEVQCSKQVQLVPESGAAVVNVDVTIGLLPLPEDEMDIWVRVSPIAPHRYLPPDLHLSVLDAMGSEVMQAEARSTEAIRLRFTGHLDEQFSLKLAIGSTYVIESFVI